ncbi:MAG: hypothetical protein DPW09_31670 [Anaerolineae bacterium]|nr:hypothetical protein [Anaerolineales bacterium]MCQ3978008.1 hypothetical protein [Anaerolineae bacterium]
MEFTFDLATPTDDPAIRRLLANNPIPSRVTVTYEREPDYFLGCATMGHFCQVLVARHRPSNEVAAVATRTTRPLFVNGQIEEVGYIGQLRVDERFRGRWLVSGGFRYFHQLHADGRVAGYITTIIEGNTEAQGILVERARRHFPVYREIDRLCTLAIILRKSARLASCVLRHQSASRLTPHAPRTTHHVTPASPADLPAIVSFLHQHGSTKQFFPVFSEADFTTSVTTLDFRVEDFVVARQNGQIIGVMGLWDQSRYKQTIVRAYHGSLRWLRPFYNGWLRLRGAKPLPPPGQPIHFAYASFICVAQNNPDTFGILLRYVYNLAVARGYAYLMVGLSTRDPLLDVARSYAHIPYYSRLYTVCWPDDLRFHEKLDQRIPYVEIATL